MAKDITRSIRLSEEVDQWLSQAVADIDDHEDCNRTKLIEAALLLAVPIIKACPSLLRRIALSDYKIQ